MPNYISLVNFTESGKQNVKESPKRASAYKAKAKSLGVKIKELLWTIGPYDGFMLFEAPDDVTASAALLALGAMGNARTITMRAFNEEEMQAIVAKAFG